MVKWEATLANGQVLSGISDDGSWRSVGSRVASAKSKLVGLVVSTKDGTGTIDANSDGYFLGNKIIASLPAFMEIKLIGIGYWKKYDDMVRIKWYDIDNMSLFETEARPIKDCGSALVKNPPVTETNPV
jgi:hypothetical protein